ncbi:MAG: tryptophan 2,3-dioxygenase [Candidatus Kapabacteria bacterium]|nr:tryptophan 2,3-dioxygenase [Ignavibacteriota bacterium]MCW5885811.1 tryptophan 2,3-dioxygenase [Candidatus Kapabacteria bacterium]
MELTYSSYLMIDELKKLQSLKSNPPEHDEMLFIIIHQAYELWFKQILHETDELCRRLDANSITDAQKSLKRINTIMKVIVHQVDILETMTPLEFLTFRNYLESASGFQSTQFRELEFALGLKDSNALRRTDAESDERAKLEMRYNSPTLWDVFLIYLKNNSYNIPDDLLNRDFKQRIEPSAEVQKILVDIYRNSPVISQFCELLLDLDEGLQEWRYRHVQMVMRTIGTKMGTGGSSGADYLKSTLFRQAFPDLWIIRAEFSI